MLLSLAINPWIAKNMSPRDYAISGYYTSFSTLVAPIIVFYMIHYYIKDYYRQDNQGREKLVAAISKALIWFSGIISLICFLGFLIYFNFIKISFPILPYLALMIFALPLTGLLNLKLAQYRMSKKAVSYFYLSVSNGVLTVACNLIFVICLKWGAFGKLFAPFFCNLIVFIYMIWRFRKSLLAHTSWDEYRTIFTFCLPLAISAMLGYFTHGFSTTYLESIGDISQYGIYVVGAQIGGYLTVFQTAINSTFQPDIYEAIIKRQWPKLVKYCALQIGLVGIVALSFILMAPLVIDILTAGRYIASTPFAQIISISTVTSAIYYLVNNYSIATNHQNLYLITNIIGGISIVGILPILVDKWAFYGGAWMVAISYIILAIINVILLGGSTYLKRIL